MESSYYSPTDYDFVIDPGTAHSVSVIRAQNGHYYFSGPEGSFDLGTNNQTGLAAAFAAPLAQRSSIANSWKNTFEGGVARYAGACSVLGRPGNAYDVSVNLGVVGSSGHETGVTCVDRATGAPLRSELSWSVTANGKTTRFSDLLEMTAIGNVPPILPPAGARPFPNS